MSTASRKQQRQPKAALSLDQFLPYHIAILARGISSSLAKKYQVDLDITYPEWRVIAYLAEVGVSSSGDICANTSMDKAMVNRAVMRLVASGLVLADISKTDRRLNVLKLSFKGYGVYERIVPMALDHEAALLKVLSQAEVREFRRTLSKLCHRAKELWGPNNSKDNVATRNGIRKTQRPKQ